MPPDDLKVTSSELRHAAGQVDAARNEVASAGSKANGDLQSRSGGWVGDSKKALENAITELSEHSDALAKRLAGQSKNINAAAAEYQATEAKNAAKIAAAGRDGTPKLNMDH